jgi:SAM-dependent methyltransferase
MAVASFYDALAPFYHLIYEDWEAGIERQGAALDALIRSLVPGGARTVLDVACGIGTQSLGLTAKGYRVTASDLSADAVERARRESAARGLDIGWPVADMRRAHDHHGPGFDVALCADNALPHLLTDGEILQTLRQFHECMRPGGLCLITVRDYAALERGGVQFKPYGVRTENGVRHLLFQVWEWRGELYDLHVYVVRDRGQDCETRGMRSTYYAIAIDRLAELMAQAGFRSVRRHDEALFQPALTGLHP